MNLQEFFSYRTHCPNCNEKLNIVFHSRRKQNIKIIDDKLTVIFPLNSIGKSTTKYQAAYSFDIINNTFVICFLNIDGYDMVNEVPLFLINRFKKLDENLKLYRVYKECTACRNYNYSSNYFKMDYKTKSIGDLSIDTEIITLFEPTKIESDRYRYDIYHLNNNYATNSSLVHWNKSFNVIKDYYHQFFPNTYCSTIETVIIPFTTKEAMIKKFDTLILFS